MPPRTHLPWDATVAEHLAAASGAAMSGGDPWIGRIIDDRYRIVELLGEGGMGSVFVAEHLKLRKQVALKTIRPEFASNAQAEARFAREALATAQIDHPHVASAIDFGHLPEGGAYLVIQLVRGVSLAAHLDTHGRIGWGTAADLGAQIADALAAAHGAGIIHRDLKPDNILIETRDDGRLHAKVLDFGIAHVADATTAIPGKVGQPLTRMGAILGTPGYMPPEQAVGEAVDARGDLYALGVILWECCTGRRLWQGESITELVACQLGSTAPTLRQELGNLVPEALSEIVAQLLSGPPSKRPDAAGPVRDTLRRLALTQTAPPPPGSSMIAASLRAALPAVLAPPRSRKTRILDEWEALRARRWVMPAIAGAFAVVLTCSLWMGDDADERVLADEAASVVEDPPARLPPASPKPPGDRPRKADPPKTPEAMPSPPGTAPSPPVGDKPPLPPELAQPLATLLQSDEKRARKRAAETIVEHKPKEAVPVYALNVAWLEKAGNCANKRGVVEKMDAAGDARVLPALKRLAGTRRKGCGFFNSQDCLDCLRENLARTIGRLESGAPAAPAP